MPSVKCKRRPAGPSGRMSLDKFAKLYASEKYGQLLLKADMGDKGDPVLELSFQIPDKYDLGLCTMQLGFLCTPEGWAARDKALKEFTQEGFEEIVQGHLDVLSRAFGEGAQ